MTEQYDPLKLASNLEQFETVVSQFAPVVGSYYQALIECGLDEDFAKQLTMNWHQAYWTVTLSDAMSRARND